MRPFHRTFGARQGHGAPDASSGQSVRNSRGEEKTRLFRIGSVGPRDLPAVRVSHGPSAFDQMMSGRKGADWIRRGAIPSDQKSLAAATAKVLRPALAASTRLRHPMLSPKTLEGSGLSPYPFERMFAHIVKAHARNHSRSMARKYLSRGVNQHQPPAPSAHACLGVARVIIRNHAINSHAARKPFLRRFHDAQTSLKLLASRNQHIPILQSPSVILGMRDFETIRSQLFRKSNHLLEMIEVLTMHNQIHGERNRKPANRLCKNDFVSMSLSARNPVRRSVS